MPSLDRQAEGELNGHRQDVHPRRVIAELEDGMTIGIGGWGSRRKPMALVRALARSDVKDLTVVTYGGADLGLLCEAGKVTKTYYGFVSLDSAPFYDPWFAKARTTGAITVREMDEGMVKCGLEAAAARLPFLPIRAGLGSDVPAFWEGELKTVQSPTPTPMGARKRSSRCPRCASTPRSCISTVPTATATPPTPGRPVHGRHLPGRRGPSLPGDR